MILDEKTLHAETVEGARVEAERTLQIYPDVVLGGKTYRAEWKQLLLRTDKEVPRN